MNRLALEHDDTDDQLHMIDYMIGAMVTAMEADGYDDQTIHDLVITCCAKASHMQTDALMQIGADWTTDTICKLAGLPDMPGTAWPDTAEKGEIEMNDIVKIAAGAVLATLQNLDYSAADQAGIVETLIYDTFRGGYTEADLIAIYEKWDRER